MPLSGGYFYPGLGNFDTLGPVNSPITSGTQTAILDNSGYFPEMTHFHSKGHKGEMFSVTSQALSVPLSGTKYWLIKTPPSGSNFKYMHFKFSIDVDTKSRIEFTESPTVAGSGSEIVSYNINRNSTNTVSDFNVYASSSITASGTLLKVNHIGTAGGSPGNPINGGATIFTEEWILRPLNYYLITVYFEGGPGDISCNIEYYFAGASHT